MSNRRKLNLAKLARTMARQLAEDADREQYEVPAHLADHDGDQQDTPVDETDDDYSS